ncbi:MAG: adenylate/guanylate cyclase domain-containing protein [Methylacidiphilales bacterium]|nr:adenylate/guanylate cyclase domain-containing protein [Candidatus Methylacidiphilales bacterium]
MRLRTVLSLLLAGLLTITGGFIGWLGYSNSHRAVRTMTEQEFGLADGIAAHEVSDFLNEPANRLLEEFSLRARRGMLNFKDDRAFGFDLAERLRVDPTLAWISYSDAKTGHFVGVWRNTDGSIVLNISTPGHGEAREEIITPEGGEIPFNRPQPKDYDPRVRDWFRNALLADTTVWSDPYQFADGVTGITASRAWRSPAGTPQGVFTVDYYLRDLEGLLDGVAQKIQGFSIILSPDGKRICSSTRSNAAALAAALADWIRAHPEIKNDKDPNSTDLVPFQVGSTSYLATIDYIEMPSGFKCVVAGMIPERVVYSRVHHVLGEMWLVGLGGVIVAILAGWFMAFRISEPLRALGNDLARVGQFYLAPKRTPRSVLHEVNQLHDAADRMKSGLRSFIKYVPDDLVRQLLSSGKEAVLGGEIRRLTIFFSDIEGFTSHSQKVTPRVLVEELACYFEILSRRLRQHSGTIDKFIGDGLLGFFNAPEKVPNHENLACRAALIGLQELALHQRQAEAVPFRTRVGLHCGDVLVGNIGTTERFAYTVLGDVVNVASRLEYLNKVYGTQIMASRDIWEHAGNDFEWRRLDRVSVAGRKGSMEIYELIGLSGGVDEERLRNRDLYEKALELYFARSFPEARRIFAQIAENGPDDRAAHLMVSRCDHMVSQELPADWDGVFVYKNK